MRTARSARHDDGRAVVESAAAPGAPERMYALSSHADALDLYFPRRSELEKRLAADTSLPEDRRARQLAQLGRTESSFLRLRRTRLGLEDFKTVKVIGKGAFGEVSRSHLPVLAAAADARHS